MPDYTGISSVEVHEAAWLSTAVDDGLPILPASSGGPWQVIQPWWTRTPQSQKTQIYVMSLSFEDQRTASIRTMPRHEITLEFHWPIRQTTSPLAEQEQQNLKNALDLLVQRIRGPVNDKTHGGAFLSVGESPRSPALRVSVEPPWVTIPADKELRGLVVYFADDFELNV